MEEKYIVFTLNEYGAAEAVFWCKTEKEAREYAENCKGDFPEEADNVRIAQLLEAKE
jgi:hypothetical protein